MDPKSNGKVSVTCLLYIMLDNCLGTIIGAVVCLVMKPGVGVAVDDDIAQSDVMETGDIFADLLRFVIKVMGGNGTHKMLSKLNGCLNKV